MLLLCFLRKQFTFIIKDPLWGVEKRTCRSSRAYTSVHCCLAPSSIRYKSTLPSTSLACEDSRLRARLSSGIAPITNYCAARPRNTCITRRIRKLETDYPRCQNNASHSVMFRHKDSFSAPAKLCGSSLSSVVNEGCFYQDPDHIAWPSPRIQETWLSGKLWPRYLSLVWL